MASIQGLLDDINLRYRNTFTAAQKLVWMNEEQRELFEILEIDSVPFSFSTVSGMYLYPIPEGVEIDKIKVMTYQVNNSDFIDIPFRKNDDRQFVFQDDYWYTILENNFYLNIPTVPVDDRLVYIYLDKEPEDITVSNLSVEPSVPVRYQEILKLGVLKRIAAARKDVTMKNSYEADYEQKIADLEWKMKMYEPEFRQPIDLQPKVGRW